MVAKSVKWALASLVIALPPAAFAVGLGDVRLLSSLNAPLDAEIELVGATPEEMAVIKAQGTRCKRMRFFLYPDTCNL